VEQRLPAEGWWELEQAKALVQVGLERELERAKALVQVEQQLLPIK
jgi:hypothetical protein